MKNPIVLAAETEADRLKQELLASSASEMFREFLRAQEVIRIYAVESVPAPMGALTKAWVEARERTTPERETESGRVVKAAKAYLEKIQSRASSSVIADALMKDGIEIGGQKGDEASRVSAYLSAAKMIFDNVRGQGYGLRGATYLTGALLTGNGAETH